MIVSNDELRALCSGFFLFFIKKQDKTRAFWLNGSKRTLEPRDRVISLFFSFYDVLAYVIPVTGLE
jgi:hypothetical protein